MGNGAGSKTDRLPPSWVYTLRPHIHSNRDGFGAKSFGFKSITKNTIFRQRKGSRHTDAARWIEGYTSGKHAFEIAFPRKLRGSYSSIGVGTKDSELYNKNPTTLVGKGAFTWGIDLSTKKVYLNGRLVRLYPPKFFEYLPDVFHMYLDMDNCKIMFGSDRRYYGPAIHDEEMKRYTIYPMVAATEEGATITIAYKGKGVKLSTAGHVDADGNFKAWKSWNTNKE